MDSAKQSNIRAAARFLGIIYITVFTFASLYAPQPLLPTINSEYRALSEATISLLMTVALLPLGIAPLVYGAFLSSMSSRKILTVALLLLGFSGALMSFFQNFGLVITARLVQGLCIPAILTCLMTHISGKFNGATLQRAMAIYIAATILGGLSGRLLAGFIADQAGWRGAILAVGAATMLGALPAAFLEGQGQAKFARVKLGEFWNIFRTPGISGLMLIDALGFFVFAAIANCLPFRLAQINPDVSDLRISLMYIGYGIGIFVAFASRRTIAFFGGECRAIVVGMSVYLVSLPVFLAPSEIMVFVAMCLICLGQFMEHSISPGLINRLTHHDKAATNGLYLSIYYAGGALGSYLPGFIFQSFGWTPFLSALALFLLLAIGIAVRVNGICRTAPEQAG